MNHFRSLLSVLAVRASFSFCVLCVSGVDVYANGSDVERWIRDLGADRYEARRAAFESLREAARERPARVLARLPFGAEDLEVRTACRDLAEAVAIRRDRSTLAGLSKLLVDSEVSVRRAAEEAVLAFAEEVASVASAVAERTEDPDPVVRRHALQFLARADPARWRKRFAERLADPNPTVRRATLDGLAAVGDPDLAERIRPLLVDASPLARHAAAEALAWLTLDQASSR